MEIVKKNSIFVIVCEFDLEIEMKKNSIILKAIYILLIIGFFSNLIFNSADKIYSILVFNAIIFGFYFLEIYEEKKYSVKREFNNSFLQKINKLSPIISGIVVLFSLIFVFFFPENSNLKTMYFVAYYINGIPTLLLLLRNLLLFQTKLS